MRPVADFAATTSIETPQADSVSVSPFAVWPAQADVLAALQSYNLLVILKARQLGITWIDCLHDLHLCLSQPGKTVLKFSKGQLEANELIRRIRFMYAVHKDRAQLPALVTDNMGELVWSNGSRVKSLPATRTAGRSFTASKVSMDEFAFMAWGPQVLEAAKPTVNDGGQLVIISSADGQNTPFHRFWNKAESGQNGYHPIFLPWTANPTRDEHWRDRLLAESLDAAAVLREYPANPIEAFTNASGLVYDVWSDGPENGNVTEAAEYLPDGGAVYWAVDDGYAGQADAGTGLFTADSHPRVFLLIQERANGDLCQFAEHLAVKTLPDEHLRQVISLGYPEPDYAVVDRSAAELKGRLNAAGIPTVSAACTVEEGIKTMRSFIGADPNGHRRYLVHPRCKHTRAEMASYRYDPATSPPRPVKAFDHTLDAARYFCWIKRNG